MTSAAKVIVNETVSVEDRVTFIWKIRDFSLYISREDIHLNSKKFTFNGKEFNGRLYTNRISSERLFIEIITRDLSRSEELERLYCYRAALQTKNNDKNYTVIVLVNDGIELIRWTPMHDERETLIPDDCLTIVCELMYLYRIPEDFVENNKGTVAHSALECLSGDLKCLFSEERNTDVVLKVETEEIPAHIAILSARSSVFSAMFEHDMTESRSRVIHIDDFSASVIRHFLMFLYSGRMEEMKGIPDDLLMELYAAADKYNVISLKEMCSQEIISKISEKSVETSATLAFTHDDKNMVDAVVDFFAKNDKLINSEMWQRLEKIFPTLAILVLNVVAKKAIRISTD